MPARKTAPSNPAEHAPALLSMLAQLKLYHWTTQSYARHKLTDSLHDALTEAVDRFVETAMGRYGRPRCTTASACTLAVYGDASFPAQLAKYAAFVQGALSASLTLPRDADLASLRDELLHLLTQARYLATLGG